MVFGIRLWVLGAWALDILLLGCGFLVWGILVFGVGFLAFAIFVYVLCFRLV